MVMKFLRLQDRSQGLSLKIRQYNAPCRSTQVHRGRQLPRHAALAVRTLVFALLAIIAAARGASAQVETADILGRVVDATGAVIPGAAVTVTNLDTGVVNKQQSNGTGEYVVPALRIGRYSVKIESEGFETYSVPEINLSQGDRARVDAKMLIGAAVTVEVGNAEPTLQTDSSVVGTVVTERQVEDLPLNGRNFMELAQILAGPTKGRRMRSPAGRARMTVGLLLRYRPTARTKIRTTS
jgi:hypothetical protein